jgi:hypothetical protein
MTTINRANRFRWLPLILAWSLATAGGCKTVKAPASWAADPILIDGRIDDWEGVTTTRFKDENATLSLANDGDYLYALFRTSSPTWARTIRMAGLKISLDARGKKRDDFYLRYRGGPLLEEPRAGMRGDRDPGSERMRPEGDFQPMIVADSLPVLTCCIKDRIIEKEIPLDGAEGPSAAFDTAMGFYIYEFAVPLTEGAIRYYGLGTEPAAKIAVGIEWGDMGAFRQDRRRPESMRSPGGIGGPGGMGPPGGMGGRGGTGSRPKRPEKQEIWIKTTLALPAETD